MTTATQPAQTAESEAPQREVILPLKEPVSIKKALLGGREARVSKAIGGEIAVFLVNIQLTNWITSQERADGFVDGFNHAAKWMQSALTGHLAAQTAQTAQTEQALTDDARPEWADCETRGAMVRNSVKHRIGELKTASNHLRKAYRQDFLRIPCEWLADAYDEAVAALESRASAIAAAQPASGGDWQQSHDG